MRYYYDLHIHSCLSPCGDDDMTPNNIANMAKIKGLDVIAVTDHNCARNAEAVIRCGEQIGLLVLPGMEIECAEEFHIVALFKDIQSCFEIEKTVTAAMPQIKNKTDIFGKQVIMNCNDEAVGEVENMLVAACGLSADKVVAEVLALGGACIPAHVDKSSYSIISNLGFIPDSLNFSFVELSKRADEDSFLEQYPYLSDYGVVRSSDAHYLCDISEQENAFELSEVSAEAVIAYLRGEHA